MCGVRREAHMGGSTLVGAYELYCQYPTVSSYSHGRSCDCTLHVVRRAS